MSRINHKIKIFFTRIKWYFHLLVWARKHAKEVSNYRFLRELKDVAEKAKLKAERESKPELAKKLTIQLNLITKILEYVDKR